MEERKQNTNWTLILQHLLTAYISLSLHAAAAAAWHDTLHCSSCSSLRSVKRWSTPPAAACLSCCPRRPLHAVPAPGLAPAYVPCSCSHCKKRCLPQAALSHKFLAGRYTCWSQRCARRAGRGLRGGARAQQRGGRRQAGRERVARSRHAGRALRWVPRRRGVRRLQIPQPMGLKNNYQATNFQLKLLPWARNSNAWALSVPCGTKTL